MAKANSTSLNSSTDTRTPSSWWSGRESDPNDPFPPSGFLYVPPLHPEILSAMPLTPCFDAYSKLRLNIIYLLTHSSIHTSTHIPSIIEPSIFPRIYSSPYLPSIIHLSTHSPGIYFPNLISFYLSPLPSSIHPLTHPLSIIHISFLPSININRCSQHSRHAPCTAASSIHQPNERDRYGHPPVTQ